jgi:hypothetical protein
LSNKGQTIRLTSLGLLLSFYGPDQAPNSPRFAHRHSLARLASRLLSTRGLPVPGCSSFEDRTLPIPKITQPGGCPLLPLCLAEPLAAFLVDFVAVYNSPSLTAPDGPLKWVTVQRELRAEGCSGFAVVVCMRDVVPRSRKPDFLLAPARHPRSFFFPPFSPA